jgi:tetratricopeptide (TPR) repeat protein
VRAARSAAVVLCALVVVARANPADDAFKKGRELRKQQKWAEACAAFEESQRLDPQLGTQFNIAECDAKLGKLATALALYKEIAKRDTNATRKAAATDLAQKLEPRVPKLQIQLAPKVAGVTVTINGTPASEPSAAQLVDFGSYEIVATAPGFDDATSSVTVADEAKVVVIALRLVPRAQPASPPVPVGKPVPAGIDASAAPRSRKKTYAVIAFAGGGVAGIGGTLFALRARSAWNDAKDVCGGATECPNAADAATANDLAATARGRGNLATILFIAGGAAAATGVVLWVTAPHKRERAATVSVHPGGMTLSGHF